MLRGACALLLFAAAPSGAAAREDGTAEARAAIEAAGGRVQQLSQASEDLLVDFALGGRAAGDAVLAEVARLPHVVELRLGRTQVTDAGLERLAGMPELASLWLQETAVGDAGLAHLEKLPKLACLNLYGTRVTGAGLEHLARMPALKRVYLWRTAVTAEEADKLRAARPELKVDLGWEPKPPPAKEPPKAEPPATCCEKAKAEGKECAHPCCVEARAKGELCAKCNPPKEKPK
jgi:hypothetical protein